MRTEQGADTSVSPAQLSESALTHPSVWMLENGPMPLPHLHFYPVIDGAAALFQLEYAQDGNFKYGTVTLPEERIDIPDDLFTPSRYEFSVARFSFKTDKFVGWHGWLIRPEDNYVALSRDLEPTTIPLSASYRYQGTSYSVNRTNDPEIMNLYVKRVLNRRVFKNPINLPFPYKIDSADLDWLNKNRQNLNHQEFQDEATQRLHFIPTIC